MTSPLSALPTTWNAIGTTFTAIKMTVTDTASAAGSKLLDLLVGSTHMFQVGKNGHSAIGPNAQIDADLTGSGTQDGLIYAETITDPTLNQFYGLATLIKAAPTANGNLSVTPAGFYGATDITNSKSLSTFNGIEINLSFEGSGQIGFTAGLSSYTMAKTGGTTAYAHGTNFILDIYNTVTNAYSQRATMYLEDGCNVTTAALFFGNGFGPSDLVASPVHAGYGIYFTDLTGFATNPYYFWADGPGVFRIKEDGPIKGTVPAGYNPAFVPKYTPGAANAERWVLQWATGNIVEVGAEAIGTGVLRKLRLLSADGLETTSKTIKTAASTVAGLPSAATMGAGAHAFVTDALTPTFGATVAGSGAVASPVYSDGANWKIG